MPKLQDALEHIPFERLPPAWTTFDLATFSRGKRLWDYQQAALQNALKALWKYYDDCADYRPEEADAVNLERKERLMEWYRAHGLGDDLSISLGRRRDIARLLDDYFPVQDGRVGYQHFINRMSFWMATGSGKTVVLVKLIQLLWQLMRLGEIPAHDVLALTHRDDLLEQLRAHVEDFNASGAAPYIRLHELRDYPQVRHGQLSLFRRDEFNIFYYRSDNLSDEQKEKIVDFRNYDNYGRWYVLLDEAHKGDKEDSKRQHIYSILARNGFLFNFSATFTDPRDIHTTAYDFNLARFIAAGYGKHISILRQENRAFRDDEDYTGAEKQKVVLKALLMLTGTARARQLLGAQASGLPDGLYHRPLLLALVNSVNTQDADLKLFFRELERIARGAVDEATWAQAKAELWDELAGKPEFMFEDERFDPDSGLFQGIGLADVLSAVYNAPGAGEIEVLIRPSNRRELALKVKTADRPFALIKIGDISGWLKDELAGYEVVAGFEDEGFFEHLNRDDSDINILMGSRSFYEGWDSNRPNVITFVNIGVGADARKFILQSVGRGVRIEPVAGKRRRLLSLYDAGEIPAGLWQQLGGRVQPLETLFIMGTNRNALHTVMAELDAVQEKRREQEIALAVNEPATAGRVLLIPVYRLADRPLLAERAPARFKITEEDLCLLGRYAEYLGDDRLLLAHYDARPAQVAWLRQMLGDEDRYFSHADARPCGGLAVIVPRVLNYIALTPQAADGLKEMEDEIRHFRHIRVALQDIGELKEKIEAVQRYQDPAGLKAELKERFSGGEIDLEAYTAGIEEVARMTREAQVTYDASQLEIWHIANHYYLPVLLSRDEKIEYIRHIIRHPSEVRFVDDLIQFVDGGGGAADAFDWWLFSKLDETLDQVYIPYYDPEANGVRRFYPDFIFWMQRGTQYRIAFVDPKGIQMAGYEHKVDGFRQLFCEEAGGPRVFTYNGLKVQLGLWLYTRDANRVSQGYRDFWLDSPESLFERISASVDEGLIR